MRVVILKSFSKQHKKLPLKIQQKFSDRLKIFLTDSTDRRLRLYPLKGKYQGCYSIDITGDFRAILQYREDGTVVVFAFIGTHSQLY
ncbi:type II toxin-antitoxin system mRNA interferase toxin, RelE/StbE family [Candidatus Saccharibacteria bacterium]|nr:type II toxin-antitoxin system mRNA interferase toxin, RelE/StbE family [Candidatus Saccharibacteria bacterium]